MKKIQKATENSTLAEIINRPGAEKILASHGVPCITCPHAAMEMDELKLRDVTKLYQLDLKRILGDLNK